jgi:hypothetical protein
MQDFSEIDESYKAKFIEKECLDRDVVPKKGQETYDEDNCIFFVSIRQCHSTIRPSLNPAKGNNVQ